ncbi:DUF262 domain-containing protein [Stutzerimonas stutzeri]|uniref:DUF262 domain-containing protein n=1 Tax=Stutzerimonas stutzeri TaxID=316 RepID=UPI00147B269F|nr:DUF262 domain-containing protein [Stutzerimonas stutzeri]WRQ05012.1 DUF262 domain-containing protein [Stutzerimonas stutzeri]
MLPLNLARQAEAFCAELCSRIASPTQYIAGFRTRLGRELALERQRDGIYCWSEAVSLADAPASPERHYPPEMSRNSNLNGKNCPRLRVGHAVHYWIFDRLDQFEAFLRWYAQSPLAAAVVEPPVVAQPEVVAPLQPVEPVSTGQPAVAQPQQGSIMGYQITSIAETLGRINRNLFIPAIQRPYVWAPEQITGLFDSIMRGYPIGALMFWDLPEGSQDDWEIYSFISDFRHGSIHNDKAELQPGQPVTLVLDGQQRLTSLLIGLKGSYTVKQKHKRKKSDDAWDERILFIDLAQSPEVEEEGEDDDVSPIAEHYRFAFFDHDQRPQNKAGELWFEVGLILAAKSEAELEQMLRSWVDANLNLDDSRRAIARANLGRLWQAVWRDNALAYFTECSASYDRVLDIFIRANSGGSPLSRSDLLMSVITLRWEQFNAREETEVLINDLAAILSPKRAINREFVLRTALFLNDLDFAIKVQNFIPSNIRLLEQSWERVKEVLRFSARFLRDHGLYGERLSGINVLMLVAYYVHKSNRQPGELQLSAEDRQRIRRWIILLGFQGLLGLQTNNTFKAYRNAVRRALRSEEGFPWEAIAEAFRSVGRPIDFGQDALARWCDTTLDQHPLAELLLSLLYADDLPNLQRRALPLVQSRHFLPDELRRAGISEAMVPVLQGFANKLIIGVALSAAEQEHYYAMPFEQWAQTLAPEFMHSHCLPSDIDLYRLERIPEWVSERRHLLGKRLFNLLADFAQPISSATLCLNG